MTRKEWFLILVSVVFVLLYYYSIGRKKISSYFFIEGYQQFQEGKYTDAKHYFDVALRFYNYKDIYQYRAYCKAHLGDVDGYDEDIKQYLKILKNYNKKIEKVSIAQKYCTFDEQYDHMKEVDRIIGR